MTTGSRPFSLYIHIPYCISKCPYCDFNSHVVAEIPENRYTSALLRELSRNAPSDAWHGRPVQSIFFGGGTPSTFKPPSIETLLSSIAGHFSLQPDCEITLEANPGTVDRGNFAGYLAAGVNRISIGVQSFQPRLLKLLGRAHSAEEARVALKVVRQLGFDNFSFDLIYAIPGQTMSQLQADLDEAVSWQAPHLSAYNLTFEEGTPFYHEFQTGRMKHLDEGIEIAMAELIEAEFFAAGLHRYEISNYARPGLESRHNVNYWRGGDYLGLGAGAHSYVRNLDGVTGRRWSNEKSPSRYMATIGESAQAVVDGETIDTSKASSEFMFLGLRMTKGISQAEFSRRFGHCPANTFPQIRLWLEEDLLEESGDFLRLTSKGLLLANSIFVHFM